MMVKLLWPNYDIDTDNNYTFRIKTFTDENNITYNTLSSFLNTITENTKVYCYFYQPMIAEIEHYCKLNNFYIPQMTDLSYWSGSGKCKKNCFSAIHLKTKRAKEVSPHTAKTIMIYNEHKILFMDLDKWFDSIPLFNMSGPNHEHYEILQHFENNFVPTYHCKANNEQVSSEPWSLASLSRVLIGSISRFKRENRDEFLRRILACYATGLNYVRDYNTYSTLYYYDISSMYPYILTNYNFPNPYIPPKHFDTFKPVFMQLALYHISYLKARLKPNHFPTVFTEKEQCKRMRIVDPTDINIHCNSLDGWITNIDYDLLMDDYDITECIIDETYIYNSTKTGQYLFGTKLLELYTLKEEAKSPLERKGYKLIMNTYSGSIGMRNHYSYRIDDLTNPQKILHLRENTSKGGKVSPYDIAAFMTAYGRKLIRDLAMKAGGPQNVVCISTDAIVVIDPTAVEHVCRLGLGGLRLDKVMHNVHWWNINQYEYQDDNGEWHGTISGLPKYMYVHGKNHYKIPIIKRNNEINTYVLDFNSWSTEEEE